MNKRPRINWTVTLFLFFTPLIGIAGLGYLIMMHQLHWQTFLLMAVFMMLSGFSITAGYHRLFAHKSYDAKPIVRLFFALFGASAFEGSVLEWCTDHRYHHRYVDTNEDPYNINAGFWYAHIGWLVYLDYYKRDFANINDLQADPLLRLQHKYYLFFAILSGFILPLLIGVTWGDPLGALILAGCLRIALNHHLTFLINSACHYFGRQTYTDENTAKDHWLIAFFTYGEGYHNFHHKFPIDYRNGIRYFHFDPSKWLIRFLSYCGLAQDLKRVKLQTIVQCRLDMDRKRLARYAATASDLSERFHQLAQPLYAMLVNASMRIDDLDKNLRQLKAKRSEMVREKWAEYQQGLQEYKKQLQQAKADFKVLLKMWSNLQYSSQEA